MAVTFFAAIFAAISFGFIATIYFQGDFAEKGWKVLASSFIAGVVAVSVSWPMEKRANEEFRINKEKVQTIRQTIAKMNLSTQETIDFQRKLDPRPSGGIFGGHSDVSVAEAEKILDLARMAESKNGSTQAILIPAGSRIIGQTIITPDGKTFNLAH